MIRRLIAAVSLVAALTVPAHAQTAKRETVTIGTMRTVNSGALFLAVARGYFAAEGIDVDMTAYKSEKDVADGVASGATDLGLGAFTPAAFNYAGAGLIKIIAAQVREKSAAEGNQVLASNAAYARGVHKLDNISNTSAAITQIGSQFHYQLAQIARAKKFDFASITLKPFQTQEAMARALGTGQADIAIMAPQYAREALVSGLAKLVGWYSEVDEQQLGALFVSSKVLAQRRPAVEKFMRGYLRGVTDYVNALARRDRYGKRLSDPLSRETATLIARYVFPGETLGSAAATVEGSAYQMDPQARIDVADLERQVAWFKSQSLIAQTVDAKAIVDASFMPRR